MTGKLAERLKGGDLRSTGAANELAAAVDNQHKFDELFECLFHPDRVVVMRSADALEKITRAEPGYLAPHKKRLLQLISTAENKELKWHLAQIAPRLKLTKTECDNLVQVLTSWVLAKCESRIVRVFALQSIFDLSKDHHFVTPLFHSLCSRLEIENIPSITARIRKLQKLSAKI